MLCGIKGSSATNIPSSKYWWPYYSPVAIHCQIYDQTQFHMVIGIENVFDHNGNVFCLISRRIISVKIGLFFQEITFIAEFITGSNFMLPTFLKQVANGIFRWQSCYLLLQFQTLDSIPKSVTCREKMDRQTGANFNAT